MRMKSAVINNTRSQETFSVLSKVIQSQGFVFLHCDNHNFEIEAIVESRFKFAKHLNARLVELSRGTELIVEVRNIGLELKRKRSNDKMEIDLVRSFPAALNDRKSRAGAA